MTIKVQQASFDMGREVQAFAKASTGAGAIVSFTGLVRDLDDSTLDRMIIEHYPGMTERALTKIRDDAIHRWSLTNALIIHRFGALQANDPIMMVATASRHRTNAFEAAEFLMDYLKSRAPFWKKEVSGSQADWVASKSEDEDALARWSGMRD